MPHPFDIQPPSPDDPGPRFTGNVVEMPRRYIGARLLALATQDRGMLAATDDIAERQRENLARFYRANPQFGRCSAVEGGLAPARPPLWQVVVAVAFVYALLLAAMVVL